MNKVATIITPDSLSLLRYPLQSGWREAVGILKGKKIVDPLTYQRAIRKQWSARLKRQIKLAHDAR